jgi:DNA-binding CsgD family transcriptional regulator
MQGNSKVGTQNGSTNGNNGSFDYEAMIEGLLSICNNDEIILFLDVDGIITRVKSNKNHWLLSKGDDLIGKCLWDLLPSYNIPEGKKSKTIFSRVLESKKPERFEDEHQGRWFDSTVYPIFDKSGKVKRVLVMGRDVTHNKKAVQEKNKLNENLEMLVERRTEELMIKTKKLEELNSTLRVLLQKRDEELRERQQVMISSINQLILPNIKKIQKLCGDSQIITAIDAIETNVKHFTAPFGLALNSKASGLTPAEIEIALLIKAGKTTKDIAEILNVSPETVDSHRKHIRRKLGINHKKENLRSYLISIQ